MEDILKRGETLFAQGNSEQAERCFLEFLVQDPNNTDACNNLGVIAFQRQATDEAIEYFTRALSLNPFHKDSILNYSFVLKSLKETLVYV